MIIRTALFSLIFASIIFSNAHASEDSDQIKILSRIEKLQTYPCTQCHKGIKINVVDKEVYDKHPGLKFKHLSEVRLCRTCHDPANPNHLVLLNGTSITFDEVPQLCGQCHGKIGFNWTRGLHGKQVGSWNGEKTRWVCTECHNPHAPKYKPMETVLNPPMSDYVIRKVEHK